MPMSESTEKTMPRHEADYGHYDRQYGGRYGGYRRRYGSEYDRAYDRGWGMTGLFNRIMRGGPRRLRPYDPDFQGGRRYGRYGGEYGPDLSDISVRLPRTIIKSRIMNGYRTDMPAYADILTPEELENIVLFIEQHEGRR
jgi:hypothetical protein